MTLLLFFFFPLGKGKERTGSSARVRMQGARRKTKQEDQDSLDIYIYIYVTNDKGLRNMTTTTTTDATAPGTGTARVGGVGIEEWRRWSDISAEPASVTPHSSIPPYHDSGCDRGLADCFWGKTAQCQRGHRGHYTGLISLLVFRQMSRYLRGGLP